MQLGARLSLGRLNSASGYAAHCQRATYTTSRVKAKNHYISYPVEVRIKSITSWRGQLKSVLCCVSLPIFHFHYNDLLSTSWQLPRLRESCAETSQMEFGHYSGTSASCSSKYSSSGTETKQESGGTHLPHVWPIRWRTSVYYIRVSTNLIKQISRRFPGDSRRNFKKNPVHVCLASVSFGELKYPALPSRIGIWGSVINSPQRSGAEPRPKTGFGASGTWKNTSDGDKFRIFARIFIHIFTTGNQCGQSSTSYIKNSRRIN